MIQWILRNNPWILWVAGALLFLRWLTFPVPHPASKSLLLLGALSSRVRQFIGKNRQFRNVAPAFIGVSAPIF
ncbi:hypothetical protein Acife_0515 [Acidithiobacillus ferrivorans SS3]|uniref:Uncharacterized protein n=1 Tax=Acidithiobacillus ferrivorans SS3 TaxID=743299 RepID=G0JTX0_9PROT|nr:hypothetical protein [Acidithiobacillus ferrivorans]AEM46722.1 hypothetical protein Acife_0515 [Acidithiobacillus ferrivorans SS3]OFA16134.1 hypothetical protein A4U49_09140 [Acidithiobacillus ferrivorans]